MLFNTQGAACTYQLVAAFARGKPRSGSIP